MDASQGLNKRKRGIHCIEFPIYMNVNSKGRGHFTDDDIFSLSPFVILSYAYTSYR